MSSSIILMTVTMLVAAAAPSLGLFAVDWLMHRKEPS